MRSPAEIRFRLRQELGNLAMLLSPPTAHGRAPIALPYPGDAYSRDFLPIADSILAHRFPILGLTIDTGPTIDWRRDYLHGISTGTEYFRRVPYLDFSRAGDHKVVWELNRHQHLVLLAQAYHLSGRREYLDEAFAQLTSWLDANPFLRGINWASALEVAFRALSWIWVWTLAGPLMPPALSRRFLDELYRHGAFLNLNLSVYFSPNTHLLGEAVALYALGAMFREPAWKSAGGRWTEDAMQRQVREDGSHFEQSAYYHVYALDFFLLYRALANPGPAYEAKLNRMAEYLDSLMGPSGILPMMGDDDGGRLFHPYGDRTRFGQATLAAFPHTPQRASRLYKDAGVAVIMHDGIQIVIKAGGFGEGSGGHSHSDVLSLVARIGGREILIDPGTYTYIADPAERNAFRGSAAHNTVRIANRDQAIPAGPFRWLEKPEVQIEAWASTPDHDFLDATCRYAGVTHRRQVFFAKQDSVLLIRDLVQAPDWQQHWHLGHETDAERFSFTTPAETIETWRSKALCAREPATALRSQAEAVVIDLSSKPTKAPVHLAKNQLTWNNRTYRLPSPDPPLHASP